MLSAGGHVPVQTVAPASVSALAMAKPYPPSSAMPATRARLPRRSMLSMKSSHEEPRCHRDQLRVLHQRMGEHAAQRPFVARNAVDGPRQFIEERVVQTLQRLLDAIVLEMVVAQQVHPGFVI